MAEAIDPLEWREGGLQAPSLNWVKATFSYGFQLRWNNFSRLSFWQWFFNVVRILLVLKKGEALLSSNTCFHHLFRARTRVVLKKVFQNSCSFISFHTHSGKVVEFRAIIFLDAWSFADFKTFIFQTFGSLLFFSHVFDCNLPPLCPRCPCCPLSPLFLAEDTSLSQCHWAPVLQTSMAFKSKDILIEEEKIKDDLLLQ